jgi:NAD(P)-dependent dehydrogenase (short-subunit alcohol dehydrogenase family)
MSGKILIYGGNGGIGSAIARRLHAKGYALHLVGRDHARLKDIASQMSASFTCADIEDPASFAQITQDAGETLRGLVYAVGTINLKMLHRLTDKDFEKDFRINALGAALALQAALPALKAEEGITSALFFSTVAAAQGFTGHSSVAMAKGAVEGLVLASAAELAPKIRINAIAPSLTRTGLASSLTGNEQMVAAIAQLHPMQRIGEPDDIAAMAAFILSEEANWMTGQIIHIDGGRSTLRTKG